jgi:hypothetical protein
MTGCYPLGINANEHGYVDESSTHGPFSQSVKYSEGIDGGLINQFSNQPRESNRQTHQYPPVI